LLTIHHGGHQMAKKFFNSATAASYDSVVSVTTFGRDAAWKREILRTIAAKSSGPVLDLACGTGILSQMLQRAGRSPAAGLDLTFDYLRIANSKVSGPLFAQGTAEVLPYRDGSFGAVVSSYLAKYVDINLLVDECWRVLSDGGVAIMHDFACPTSGSIMRALWGAYFIVLRAAGIFAKSWRPVFADLDRVICESCWAQQAADAMAKRGFVNVTLKRYTGGTAAIVEGHKKT
jgi:demethylmenaquinone methyltransferase/2-methoxy-6-polyprenyl-1,4-benzoquinol methylase